MRVALIDNYDSFTYNLVALLRTEGAEVDVMRNDKVDYAKLEAADLLVFSPGPSIPENAGQLKSVIEQYAGTIPMLGVCLGMQAIGEVFGAKLELLDAPLHGISKPVHHFNNSLFESIPKVFEAARYHSWVVSKSDFPADLQVIAESPENDIMGIQHREYQIYGLQFHPESILTGQGGQIVTNIFKQLNTKQSEEITRTAF